MRAWVFPLAALALCAADFPYQKPPQAVLDVLNAPWPPAALVNPSRTHLALLERDLYPPIADLAQPMLRLAGLRINPKNQAPHNPTLFPALTLKRIADGQEKKVALPAGMRVFAIRWSPDGAQFALALASPKAVELWIGDTVSGAVRRIPNVRVNAAYGDPVQWASGSRRLLVRTVPAGLGAPPEPPAAPAGPVVQESEGKPGPQRTLQDMLTGPHDEALFEHYVQSQLAFVDAASGRVTPVGKPAVFGTAEPSPDGKYLLVARVVKPYSYLHSVTAFPREVEVWDAAGKVAHTLAKLPLQQPVAVDAVSPDPRSYRWSPVEPAKLVWVQALDGGDPRKKVPHRDRVLTLAAPFAGEPVELVKTAQRFSSIRWLDTGGQVLVRDYDRDRRWSTTVLLPSGKTLWSFNIQDRYRDPGNPITRTLPDGSLAVRTHGDEIFLEGEGATPKGSRPFLRRYNLKTGETAEVFRSEESHYEEPVALLDAASGRLLTRRESSTEPPNYYVRDGGVRAVTAFADPTPQLRKIRKQLVTYKRSDGVPLSFTLYLPPDYKEGTRLPTVVWAYPREFNDPETAGQIAGSTNRFTSLYRASHLFFLLAGYAVLDNASIPIVGSPEKANDTYVEQLVASAKAAIDKAVEMGVTDPKRVGVGGHSYGAFMTANLLAHCDLFRAGIARSGAYNRTLTPFGFQNERRTLWDAPELYLKMSPMMAANKIDEPVLLLHGEADNNPGTFPIQSERLYQAIRGNGGAVRYVELPHESHSYAARESVEHTLWEMIRWFDKHVKDPPPRTN